MIARLVCLVCLLRYSNFSFAQSRPFHELFFCLWMGNLFFCKNESNECLQISTTLWLRGNAFYTNHPPQHFFLTHQVTFFHLFPLPLPTAEWSERERWVFFHQWDLFYRNMKCCFCSMFYRALWIMSYKPLKRKFAAIRRMVFRYVFFFLLRLNFTLKSIEWKSYSRNINKLISYCCKVFL